MGYVPTGLLVSAVVLPTRVLSAHEVGLASAGPSGPSGPSGPAGQAAAPYRTLLKSRSGLAFAAMRQVAPEWTADQMAGGYDPLWDGTDGAGTLAAAGPYTISVQGADPGTGAPVSEVDLPVSVANRARGPS